MNEVKPFFTKVAKQENLENLVNTTERIKQKLESQDEPEIQVEDKPSVSKHTTHTWPVCHCLCYLIKHNIISFNSK